VLPDPASLEEQAQLQQLAARHSDPAPARQLGDYYLGQDRPFAALWAFSQSLQAQPGDPTTTMGLARALEAGLLQQQAIERLRAVVAKEPGWTEAGTRLAELYLRTGRAKDALSGVWRLGASGLARPEGAELEGRALEATGDGAGAERAYRRAASAAGSSANPWQRLGRLQLAQGRYAEARQSLTRARELAPGDPEIATDLGRALTRAGNAKKAMGVFRAAVAIRPYAPAYYQGGLLLARQGRREDAVASFARALAADREYADAYRALADALQASGRRAEAHYQRGLYYSVKDLRARSLREYVAMAAVDPKRPTGLLMASQSHAKMFHSATAIALARRALENHPRNREVREQLIAVAVMGNARGDAAKRCQEWLREQPDAVQPLWMLGQIAVEDLKFAEGMGYFNQALAREPENPLLLQSLGSAILAAPGSKDLPRAVTTLTRAAILMPEDGKLRYELGLALMRTGRLPEAQRQMLRSLDLDPHRGAAYSMVVQLARQLRQPGVVALFGPLVRAVEQRLREELSLWRRTWDQPKDPEGYRALARFLVHQGDLRKAESQLEEALVLRPRWSEVEAELAQVRRLLAVQ
jgi:tetratricopeptide (TPR) repeat protein